MTNKNTNPNLVDPIYDSFIKVLDDMETRGIDRVVLSLAEFTPKNSNGRGISEDETHYYPFELLTKDEQEMILKGKSYQVVSLVRKMVFEQVEYHGRGLEIYNRTRINPFLPSLKPVSPLFYPLIYVSEGRVFAEGNEMREIMKKAGEFYELVEEANRIINASSPRGN